MVAIVCELDVVIYISLIDGLCKMGELDFSIELQILMVDHCWPSKMQDWHLKSPWD